MNKKENAHLLLFYGQYIRAQIVSAGLVACTQAHQGNWKPIGGLGSGK